MIAAGSLGGVRFGLPRRWRRTLGAAPSGYADTRAVAAVIGALPSSPFVVARIGHGPLLRSAQPDPPSPADHRHIAVADFTNEALVAFVDARSDFQHVDRPATAGLPAA